MCFSGRRLARIGPWPDNSLGRTCFVAWIKRLNFASPHATDQQVTRSLNSGSRPLKEDMVNPLLISAAALSTVAALLHIGCIIFGASWYRFFGAGERMAQLAAAGNWRATFVTSGIVLMLVTWSLYALSGADLIPRLPYVRLALCGIAGIYLLRGVAGFALAWFAPGSNGPAFWWWSSTICLTIGVVHVVGIWQAWPRLCPATT